MYKLERNRFSIPLFWVVFGVDLVFHLILSFLLSYYDPQLFDIKFFEENTPLGEVFFFSVIFGPLVETFIFQYLIIELLYLLKKINLNVVVIVSSLAFGLSHNYNMIYMVVIFISGLVYASYYLYLKIKKKISILASIMSSRTLQFASISFR